MLGELDVVVQLPTCNKNDHIFVFYHTIKNVPSLVVTIAFCPCIAI